MFIRGAGRSTLVAPKVFWELCCDAELQYEFMSSYYKLFQPMMRVHFAVSPVTASVKSLPITS